MTRQQISYDVFLSYRREGGDAQALIIREKLVQRGLRVFLDVTDLHKGYFDEALLQYIDETPSFIVILSPGSLDRCQEEGDWLRREIAQAIKAGKNIVPVLMKGFRFPPKLPEDISTLPRHQAVEYSHSYHQAMIESILASVEAERVDRQGKHVYVQPKQTNVTGSPPPFLPNTELTPVRATFGSRIYRSLRIRWIVSAALAACVVAGAVVWWSRHDYGANYENSSRHKVFLKHKYDGIDLMRGGHVDEAIKEYRDALAMEPNDDYTHFSLAEALAQQGDLRGAIAEYRESLRLRPGQSNAEVGLANALFRAGNLDGAISEYRAITNANRKDDWSLDPSTTALVHNNYGLALLEKGDAEDAVLEFRLAIKAKPGWQEPEDNLRKALARSQTGH